MSHLMSHLEFLLASSVQRSAPRREQHGHFTRCIALSFTSPTSYQTTHSLSTMPAEYAEYLAANVLNEQQLVCLVTTPAMLL